MCQTPARPEAGLALVILIVSALVSVAAVCSGEDTSTMAGETNATATPTVEATPLLTPVPIANRNPVQHGFADIGDGELYYQVYGQGQPLLLIPGLSANHLSWAEQVGRFATRYQVIIYDPRGTGQSSPITPGFTIADMAADAAALLDALGLRPVHVYGASMGGMVAQELAIQRPDRVASLILGGTTPGGPLSVPAEGWALNVFLGAPDPDGLGRSVLDVLYSPDFIREHPDRIAEGLGLIGDYPVTRIEVIAAQLMALSGHDVYDRLPQIDIPTLVLHGTDDPLIPAANGQLIADQIPNARLILLEGARHSYRTEVAEADTAVVEFLAQLVEP